MSRTIGQVLSDARAALGLSLAEVSFQTRIRERYLTALENDLFEDLPSAVQGKGFLRNYASFLKLDESRIMEAWYHPEHIVKEKEAAAEEAQPKKKPARKKQKAIQKPPKPETQPEPPAEPEERVLVIHDFTGDQPTPVIAEPQPEQNLKASQIIFRSIGAELKKQRESLNLSLDDIERYTSIRLHYLQALESGRLEDLPSVVQGKGMLSNYANFLNVNSDEVLLRFAEGLQIKRDEQYAPQRLDPLNPPRVKQPSIASPGWRRFITADLIIVGALIISLFVFVLWGAANVARNQSADGSPTAPSLSEILLESTDEPTQTTGTNTTVTATQASGVVAQPSQEIEGEDITAGLQNSPMPVNLSIVANQRAFVKVIADGREVFSGRVVPGNAYEFSGSESVELLTGNAAALDIYFNQQLVGSIGALGEVVTLIFTAAEEMVTPTPQFTFTPTITAIPSATPRPTITPTSVPPSPTPSVTPYIP